MPPTPARSRHLDIARALFSSREDARRSIVGDLPRAVHEETLRAIAGAAPWATVVDESEAPAPGPEVPPIAARVVAGDPAPVQRALQAREAALALQVDDAALWIASIDAPARVVTGMRVEVMVGVGGVPRGPGAVLVVLRDAGSGLEQGRAEVEADAANDGAFVVAVPWLATREGVTRLQVEASHKGKAVRAAPVTDVAVDVGRAGARVAVLEARPTWAARFARLALEGVDGVHLHTEVRVSPGVAVRTGTTGQPDAGHSTDDAEVVLVGGFDALTNQDVARLEGDVRERGRAVVLLADEAPGPGPWTRLWPDPTGAVRHAPRPVIGLVAGHPWQVQEWLNPTVSTATTPLAYLDSGSPPFLLGRGLGAGRVLLVTALDAWRWRAAEGVAFAAGWRALVQRLAVDVPPPVAGTAWITGRGRDRSIHLDVAVRPDLRTDGALSLAAEFDAAARRGVPLARIEAGRWRGAVRVTDSAGSRLLVEARMGAQVVGRAHTVVEVGPAAPPASWEDVERHQAERGALSAGPGTLVEGLTGVRSRLEIPGAGRWYVTRTWWFAGLALSLLGAEWLLRRLHGER